MSRAAMPRLPAELQRIAHTEGDLLRAHDLNAGLASEDELRWWHNRAFHEPYGIALGLSVKAQAPGDTADVTVEPGLAYDTYGRELLLSDTAAVDFPPGLAENQVVDLVLAWPAGAQGTSCESRGDDPCGPAAAALVELRWRTRRPGRLIEPILARFVHRLGKTERDASFRPVRSRALRRAKLARGETSRTATVWERWTVEMTDPRGVRGEVVAGVQTRIDTRLAGFAEDPTGVAPSYFAGAHWNKPEGGGTSTFFGHVVDASPTGFTYRLLLRGIGRRAIEPAAAFATIKSLEGPAMDIGSKPFHAGSDAVIRLSPVSTDVVRIASVSGQRLRLAAPLQPLLASTRVGVFRRPIVAVAQSAARQIHRIELTTRPRLAAGTWLARAGDDPATALAYRIATSAGSAVTLGAPPSDWKEGDTLIEVKPAGAISRRNGAHVTLQEAVEIGQDKIAYILPRQGDTASAVRVTEVSENRKTLRLGSPAEDAGAGASIGVPGRRLTLKTAASVIVALDVDDASLLRPGDFIGRLDPAGDGDTTSFAHIDNIDGNTLILDRALPGIEEGTRVVRYAIVGRTTIRTASPDGRTLVVGSTEDFTSGLPVIARAGGPTSAFAGTIADVQPGRIQLADGSRLGSGQVISACRKPESLRIASVSADGRSIELVGPTLLAPGMLVCRDDGEARGAAVTIRAVNDRTVELDAALDGLAPDNVLVELEEVGVLDAITVGTQMELRVTNAGSARVNDLLGLVRRWKSRAEGQRVTRVDNNTIVLARFLDGALPADTIGLADVIGPTATIRVVDVAGLAPSDALLVSGSDALIGETILVNASILGIDRDRQTINLGIGSGSRMRPESLTMGLFYNARFAELFPAEARRDGLYVAWLGFMDGARDTALVPQDAVRIARKRET